MSIIFKHREWYVKKQKGKTMIKLYTSVAILLSIYFWAIIEGGSLASFTNLPGLVVVIVPAVLFAISGEKDLKTRVENFASGAVLAGWLGTLIGAIMILGNIDFNTWQESLPPASAIMLLTVLYGYTAKAVCFLIAENLPE